MALPVFEDRGWRRIRGNEHCPHCGRRGQGCIQFDHGGVGCMHTSDGEPFPDGKFLGARKVNWPLYWGRQAEAPRTPAFIPPPVPRAVVPLASLADRDTAYQAALAAWPLSEAHRHYLLECGLLPGDLAHYGTLRAGGLQMPLPDEAMAGVPGLVRKPDGTYAPALASGLVVPSYDVSGKLQALRVRQELPDGGKRYLWLSSASGASTGTPATVQRPRGHGSTYTVWLTEGEKKAHLCALRQNAITIGIAGIGCYAAAEEPLTALRKEGYCRLVIALDEDENAETREKVEACRLKLTIMAARIGWAIEVARWDYRLGKGIDDLPPDQVPIITPFHPLEISCPGAEPMIGQMRALLRSPLPHDEFRTAIFLLCRDGLGDAQPVPTWMEETARETGFSALCSTAAAAAKAVGRSLKGLAEHGMAYRIEKRNPDNGHLSLEIAYRGSGVSTLPARLLQTTARLRDAVRKRRCHHCGSEDLQLVCRDCGCIVEDSRTCVAESATPDQREGMYIVTPGDQQPLPPMAESAFGYQTIDSDQQSAPPVRSTGRISPMAPRVVEAPDVSLPPLADSAVGGTEATAFDRVLEALRAAPEGLPLDWLRMRTDLEHSAMHQALQIGLRNHKIRTLPAQGGHQAPRYALA